MPGWGTRRVTYGEKGWGTTISFLTSAGLSLVGLISGAYEGDVKEMTLGLIAGGIAGTIYICDIINVISKGFKNMKESKRIHNKFNGNTIILKEQKIEVK